MIKKISNYLLIITLLFVVSPLLSSGQTPLGGSFLNLSISPQNPEPLKEVRVSLESYTYDLDRSRITWLVNGVEKKVAMGVREFTVIAGKNGQKMTIKARVETPNDGTQEAEVSFTPAIVDLIYESFAYTPPFYKGRALNPNQGVVVVNALPEFIKNTGDKIPIKNIIYAWKKDGLVQQSASGVGKNTFTFSGTVPIRDVLVSVTASSPDGSIIASKQVNITNYAPKIVFYENSPIYGIMFNKAIRSSVNMLIDEFSVIAIPYFFGASSATSPSLNYEWNMNGDTVQSQDPKNSFTTRIDKAGTGTANIGLKISNTARIFQFIDNNYTINFSKQ